MLIRRQSEIDQQLRSCGVRDLVGDYGEILAHAALGGTRMHAVNEGFDIEHPR